MIGQVQHQRRRVAAEEAIHEVTDGPLDHLLAFDGRAEYMGLTFRLVRDVSFPFQSAQKRLDRRVGNPAPAGKFVAHVLNGSSSELPDESEDFCFGGTQGR